MNDAYHIPNPGSTDPDYPTAAITYGGGERMNNYSEQSHKLYMCTRCGCKKEIKTNHDGNCWSWGKVNTCPQCPPWAKYPEFGGSTTWELCK